MPFIALAAVLLAPLLAVLLLPVSLVVRYRTGTARRRARGWVAALNVAAAGLSAAMLTVFASVATVWVPGALVGALAGLAAGGVLALAGLALTRWEPTRPHLYLTPNRWLVLTITLVVAARLAYGVWRGWHAWAQAAGDGAWLAAAGVPGSLAAAGIVLGYYVVYWLGVRRRITRHARIGAIVTIDQQTGQITYDRPARTRR